MTKTDDNGGNGDTDREVAPEAQLVAGVFLMIVFAALIWLVLGLD